MTPADASEARAELAWYFHGGREAEDLASNFGAMAAHLEALASDEPPLENWTHTVRVVDEPRSYRREISDWRLERLAQARPIRRALAAIGPDRASVLEIDCLAPKAGTEAFGPHGTLAPQTREAAELHASSATTRSLGEWLINLGWHAKQRDPKPRVQALRIRHGCEALFGGALAAFIVRYRRMPTRPAEARIRRAKGIAAVRAFDAP